MYQRFIFIVLLFGYSFAQTAPFEEFVLGLWPEYDHPGILVTIQIDIPEEELPYDININLPDGSRMALQKGYDENGEELMLQQDIIVANDETIMPVHMTNTHFYSQFYFNPFKDANHREMSYEFSTDKLLDHYHILIQRHMSARNFVTNLPDPEIFENDFGIQFYRQHLDSLKANEKYLIELSYDNPDNETTVDILQREFNEQESSSNQQAFTDSRSSESITEEQYDSVKIYTFILFIIFIIAIFIIIRRKGNEVQVTNSSKHFNDQHRYCVECGSILTADQRYCSDCGRDNHAS